MSRCTARQRQWQKNTIGLHCWNSHSRGILNRIHAAVAYNVTNRTFTSSEPSEYVTKYIQRVNHQSRSQPHSPGWARVPLSSFFPQISINFSSNFTYFLPHFGPPGGRAAHSGRPWLCHCKSFYNFNWIWIHLIHLLRVDMLFVRPERFAYLSSSLY